MLDVASSRLLLQQQRKVSLDESDGDLMIHIEPTPLMPAPVLVFMFFGGLAALITGLYFFQHQPKEPTYIPFASSLPFVLVVFGGMSASMSAVFPLIKAVQEPPKPTCLHVHLGILHADRSIAGDYTVSRFNADEIDALLIEESQLSAIVHGDPKILILSGNPKISQAVATLLALHLWHPLPIGSANKSQLVSLFPYVRIQRTFIVPQRNPQENKLNA